MVFGKGDSTMSEEKIKVIIAKSGLDGHDRGAKVIAHSFRDAGFEVIYLGLRQTPEMIVQAAIDEDADVIGISSLSGAHMAIFPQVVDLIRARKMNHIVLIGGGVIPKQDQRDLESAGVDQIFGPGTSTRSIVDFIRDTVQSRRQSV